MKKHVQIAIPVEHVPIAITEKSLLSPIMATFLTFMSIGIMGIYAQNPVTTELQMPVQEEMCDKAAPSAWTISGIVTGPNGPLQCVAVINEGSGISVFTDSEGGYFIEAGPGQMLVFSYQDFLIQKSAVDLNKKVIDVSFEEEILDEVVVTAYKSHAVRKASVCGIPVTMAIERKRTFFGRIFHAIGNLFR
jgi:hypothetical protein